MDHIQLSSCKRSKLQQLARRESLKANLKNAEIIRLLLEKYPDGVPESTDKPSVLKHSTSSPSKVKQPARRSKRKSTVESGLPSVKAEEIHPNLHAEPTLDDSDIPCKGRNVRSMAPPPVTPIASFGSLQPPARRRLPTTPLIDTVFEPQARGETETDVDAHDTGHQPETTPTPPEAAAATSHQAREMLRSLTDIIDVASLDPEEPSSVLYRAKALNAILDTTIVPRMMKVDKDIKDIVWMRAAVEEHLGPRYKGKGILPESRHREVSNARPDLSSPAPRPPSPKRPREEEASPPRASKRTRVQ